jgi:hypothetical protein
LFFSGLGYLQYQQQIINISWDKLQAVSQTEVTTIANVTTTQILGFNNTIVTMQWY